MGCRVGLVTGANRGIGFEICKQLLAHLDVVYATGRNAEFTEKAASTLGVRYGRLDLACEKSIQAVSQRVKEEEGGLDVLVLNGGVNPERRVGYEEMTKQNVEINYKGNRNTLDAFMPIMREHSRIVVVSSTNSQYAANLIRDVNLKAKLTSPTINREELDQLAEQLIASAAGNRPPLNSGWTNSPYSISKLFLNCLVRIVSKEEETTRRNILINACCPGLCKTRMGGSHATKDASHGARLPLVLATLPNSPFAPNGNYFSDA